MGLSGNHSLFAFRRIIRVAGDVACSMHDEAERRECDSVLVAMDAMRKAAADQGVKIGDGQLLKIYEDTTGQRAQLRFSQLVYNARSRHMVRRSQNPKQLVDECIRAMEDVK